MIKRQSKALLKYLHRHWGLSLALVFVFIYLFVFISQSQKEIPLGGDFESRTFVTKSEDIRFLKDLNFEKDGQKIYEQEIFDRILKRINGARHYILADMFLFNDMIKAGTRPYRPLSEELCQALIDKKKKDPSIKIDFISDPINNAYSNRYSEDLLRLRRAGVNVIISDLEPLRDSNPIYSSLWRMLFQAFGRSEEGRLKNPFGSNGPRVGLRSYLELPNFKANHRKVFIADSREGMVSIISSANPHDGSSAHSNVAIESIGSFWQSLWYSESFVATLAGKELQSPPIEAEIFNDNNGDYNLSLALITERKIKNALLEGINDCQTNDEINLAVFYLSDRDVIKALLDASDRGVKILIVMDSNKDAFGYKKIGVPNRPVAAELVKKSAGRIKIRWYDTDGEQFHAKLAYIAHKDGPTRVLLGSANFTRRNLENYNLESNALIIAPSSTVFIQDVKSYFDRIWNNLDGNYSLDYPAYADDSFIKYLIYRLQEQSGLSSF
jgi:phosphatidylserine/phosphatidylglycerophosphate/cardiolipin synthase-like enzyme